MSTARTSKVPVSADPGRMTSRRRLVDAALVHFVDNQKTLRRLFATRRSLQKEAVVYPVVRELVQTEQNVPTPHLPPRQPRQRQRPGKENASGNQVVCRFLNTLVGLKQQKSRREQPFYTLPRLPSPRCSAQTQPLPSSRSTGPLYNHPVTHLNDYYPPGFAFRVESERTQASTEESHETAPLPPVPRPCVLASLSLPSVEEVPQLLPTPAPTPRQRQRQSDRLGGVSDKYAIGRARPAGRFRLSICTDSQPGLLSALSSLGTGASGLSRARLQAVMAGSREHCPIADPQCRALQRPKQPPRPGRQSYWMDCVDQLLAERSLTEVREPGYSRVVLKRLGPNPPALPRSELDWEGQTELLRLLQVVLADLLAEHLP